MLEREIITPQMTVFVNVDSQEKLLKLARRWKMEPEAIAEMWIERGLFEDADKAEAPDF